MSITDIISPAHFKAQLLISCWTRRDSSRPTGILGASAVIQTANSNRITIGNPQTQEYIFGTRFKAMYLSEDSDLPALFRIQEPGVPVGHPSSSSLWALNARLVLNLKPEHITRTVEVKRLKSNRYIFRPIRKLISKHTGAAPIAWLSLPTRSYHRQTWL